MLLETAQVCHHVRLTSCINAKQVEYCYKFIRLCSLAASLELQQKFILGFQKQLVAELNMFQINAYTG